MYLYILSKLFSESLLSLYPIFVKYINIPLGIKLWSRFSAYLLVSFFFVNWGFILKNIASLNGFLLGFVTLLHVYFSYRGFEILDSGVAYTLFYTYPLMILLLSGNKLNYLILFSLLGVYMLSKSSKKTEESFSDKQDKDRLDKFLSSSKIFSKNNLKERFKYEGVLMVLLAALTEAFIYFIVRRIKTFNNWNHLFLSYLLGGIVLTLYYFKKIKKIEIRDTLTASMGINILIGLIGYLLRFYATTRLNTKIYASLSYFGIIMSYIYGILLNKDKLTLRKVIGTLLIVIPNLWLVYTQ